METLGKEYAPSQSSSKLPPGGNFKELSAQVCQGLFKLHSELDLLQYIREQDVRGSKFSESKNIYRSLREAADLLFGINDNNPYEPEGEKLLRSCLQIGDQMDASYEGLDCLQVLLNKIGREEYENMQYLLTYPKFIQSTMTSMLADLKASLRNKDPYFGLINRFQSSEQRFTQAILDYRKARETELSLAIDSLRNAAKFIEDSIVEQYGTNDSKKKEPNEELKEIEKKEQKVSPSSEMPMNDEVKCQTCGQKIHVKQLKAKLIEDMQRYGHEVEKKVIKSYDTWGQFFLQQYFSSVALLQGKEVVYQGNRSGNIDVLKKNLEIKTTIDIQGMVFTHGVEINDQLFLCASWNDKRLHKYSLPDYRLLQSHEVDSEISHILWLKDSLVCLSCLIGELVLFDYNQFTLIHKLNPNIEYLFKSVHCLEDSNKLFLCSERGVTAVKINNNQFQLLNEQYENGEWISDILQIRPFEYVICYVGYNDKLIGMVDLKSKEVKVINNPKGVDSTRSIYNVNGLNDVAIIQTKNDLFLFNCTTQQLTHITNNYSTKQCPHIVSEFDANYNCFHLYAIQKDKENDDNCDLLDIKLKVKNDFLPEMSNKN